MLIKVLVFFVFTKGSYVIGGGYIDDVFIVWGEDIITIESLGGHC
jgi:hypothetical protein